MFWIVMFACTTTFNWPNDWEENIMTSTSVAEALIEENSINLLDRDLSGLELEPWPAFPEEDVLGGNPGGHRGRVLYRDPTRLYSVGVWCCPRARFRTVYGGTEFAHVITGSATVTNVRTGEERTFETGDHFFVHMGTEVIWNVHEEFRKVYSMYEISWDEERFY